MNFIFRFAVLFCFIVFLLTACSSSSDLQPGCSSSIDVSFFSTLAALPADTTSTASTDWRSKGMVTPVKNEGTCSASWAFGITGLVEGYHALNTGLLLSLSEQQMIDCDAGSNACSANADPVAIINAMILQTGLESEVSYPYTGTQGTCQYNPAHVAAAIPDVGLLPAGDEESLKAYVARKGPVLAFIDACHSSFTNYTSGIYYEPACSSTNPTRAVLIVGYGTDDTDGDYWIVKTSLGTSWGVNGYIYMSRNRSNNCGIASFALYPTH
jgi:cathepsin L